MVLTDFRLLFVVFCTVAFCAVPPVQAQVLPTPSPAQQPSPPAPAAPALAKATPSTDSGLPPAHFGLRLGPLVGPRFGYTVGLDAELPRASIGPNWSTRLDADLIWIPRTGALFDKVNDTFGASINQLYSFSRRDDSRWYLGGGIGGYAVPLNVQTDDNNFINHFYSSRVNFGGKLILGTQFAQWFGVEANLHMVEYSRPLLTVQARLSF